MSRGDLRARRIAPLPKVVEINADWADPADPICWKRPPDRTLLQVRSGGEDQLRVSWLADNCEVDVEQLCEARTWTWFPPPVSRRQSCQASGIRARAPCRRRARRLPAPQHARPLEAPSPGP